MNPAQPVDPITHLKAIALRWYCVGCGVLALFLTGCGTYRAKSPNAPAQFSSADFNPHPFRHQRDSFSFANQTRWSYRQDPVSGRQITYVNIPQPDYTLHCFVLVRAAKKFYFHAEFDFTRPEPSESQARQSIQTVLRRSDRKQSLRSNRVVIGGFDSLYTFSQRWEAVLKEELGGAWESYFQRGHWRMLLPFSRSHQERLARHLVEVTRTGQPTVLHVVRFPQLTINHALLVFGSRPSDQGLEFLAYDPNNPERELRVLYRREDRTFYLPLLPYFIGGQVDAYEVCRDLFH